MFELHPQLAEDCFDLGAFPLCRLLLMNDCTYPWCILVPQREGLREIHELAAQVGDTYDHLHVLINNAGLTMAEHVLTDDGYETTFAVNHLAYFLLTHELYPHLVKAPDARVVNVASDSHFQTSMNFEDLNLKRTENEQFSVCSSTDPLRSLRSVGMTT